MCVLRSADPTSFPHQITPMATRTFPVQSYEDIHQKMKEGTTDRKITGLTYVA